MPSTAIWIGRLLIVLGIIGFGYGMYNTGEAHYTALIPAAFGIVLMVLGHLAAAKENLRMHVMHVAVLVGLIGFLISGWLVISNLGGVLTAPGLSKLVMAILCLIFVALSVKSFIDARRNR